MSTKSKLAVFLFPLVLLTLSLNTAVAGVPEVDNLFVTDVTPKSFSVIWTANEACTAGLEVFEDENGTLPVSGAVITPHPVNSGDASIKTAAENYGVMKVRVTGLDADTAYYFRTVTTSKSTSETIAYPDSAPLPSVATETLTVRTTDSDGDVVPFGNDVIIEACYLEDGATPAEGTLLLATAEGGNYPVTVFVGDGATPPNALIDLNNIYDRETHENLDLSQGLNLTLLNLRGTGGNAVVTHEVPEDLSLSEVKPAQSGLKPGWNMVSFPLEPSVTDIEEVIGSLGDKVDAVWAYAASTGEWFSIDHSVPAFLWDLEELHSVSGYWFVMNSEDSLGVHGNFISQSVRLYPGWNLVGSRWLQTVDLMEAVSVIYDKLDAVWTYDSSRGVWLSYDKNIPSFLNDLLVMEPGRAYWLVMNETCNGEDCKW